MKKKEEEEKKEERKIKLKWKSEYNLQIREKNGPKLKNQDLIEEAPS